MHLCGIRARSHRGLYHKGESTMSLIDTLNKVKPLGVEFVNLSDELRRFRVRLEGEADDVPL